MLKKLNIILFAGLIAFGLNPCSYAEDDFDDDVFAEYSDDFEDVEPIADVKIQNVENDMMDNTDDFSANALNNYDVNGSLFEKITNLEQEKVVIQLEKERAQLDLELDRLNAERMKLQMEMDTLSGRAEQQQHELETAKKQLEIQTEQLMRQRDTVDEPEPVVYQSKTQPKNENVDLTKKYKLVNLVGVGNQLQATIEEISSGQNKRIFVGKELDGYIVKSISLNDGIVFEKDGETESLNIGK